MNFSRFDPRREFPRRVIRAFRASRRHRLTLIRRQLPQVRRPVPPVNRRLAFHALMGPPRGMTSPVPGAPPFRRCSHLLVSAAEHPFSSLFGPISFLLSQAARLKRSEKRVSRPPDREPQVARHRVSRSVASPPLRFQELPLKSAEWNRLHSSRRRLRQRSRPGSR